MPPLKNPRWEQFAQLLAKPHPTSKAKAYEAVGFRPNPGHAYRVAAYPIVAARIAELQDNASRIIAAATARAEAQATTNIAISRQSLVVEAESALKIAANNGNAQGMVAAIRLLAELAQISLKAPDDKQPTQHLHLHEAASLIDRPPTETLEQWIERKRLEADARATAKLKLVGKD